MEYDCCNHNPVISSLMIYHRICNNSIMMGLHVEHHLHILPGECEFTLAFNGVHVARCLVFCVMFCRPLFVLGHCFVCPSIYEFRLPLSYLQTLLCLHKKDLHQLEHIDYWEICFVY